MRLYLEDTVYYCYCHRYVNWIENSTVSVPLETEMKCASKCCGETETLLPIQNAVIPVPVFQADMIADADATNHSTSPTEPKHENLETGFKACTSQCKTEQMEIEYDSGNDSLHLPKLPTTVDLIGSRLCVGMNSPTEEDKHNIPSNLVGKTDSSESDDDDIPKLKICEPSEMEPEEATNIDDDAMEVDNSNPPTPTPSDNEELLPKDTKLSNNVNLGDLGLSKKELEKYQEEERNMAIDKWLEKHSDVKITNEMACNNLSLGTKAPILGEELTKSLLEWDNGIGYLPGTNLTVRSVCT